MELPVGAIPQVEQRKRKVKHSQGTSVLKRNLDSAGKSNVMLLPFDLIGKKTKTLMRLI
jgi:hypothetical protein